MVEISYFDIKSSNFDIKSSYRKMQNKIAATNANGFSKHMN